MDPAVYWAEFAAWASMAQAVIVAVAAIIAVSQLWSSRAAAQFTTFVEIGQQWQSVAGTYEKFKSQLGEFTALSRVMTYTFGKTAEDEQLASAQLDFVHLIEWMVQAAILIERRAIDPNIFYARYSLIVVTFYKAIDIYVEGMGVQGMDMRAFVKLYSACNAHRQKITTLTLQEHQKRLARQD